MLTETLAGLWQKTMLLARLLVAPLAVVALRLPASTVPLGASRSASAST